MARVEIARRKQKNWV